MTKKEKDKKIMADIRKQALLASGVQIEGLQQVSGSDGAKKIVYSNRKKKGPEVKDAHPIPESPQMSDEDDEENVKDDRDPSSDDESKAPISEGVKDSWEVSSEEDEEEKVETLSAPVHKPTATSANSVPKGAR